MTHNHHVYWEQKWIIKSYSELFIGFLKNKYRREIENKRKKKPPKLVPKLACPLKSSRNILRIPAPRLYPRPLNLLFSGGWPWPSVLFMLEVHSTRWRNQVSRFYRWWGIGFALKNPILIQSWFWAFSISVLHCPNSGKYILQKSYACLSINQKYLLKKKKVFAKHVL